MASEKNIREAFARLSMLEFALEIVIANELSKNTLDISQRWKSDFVRMMKNPRLPDSLTPGSEQLEAYIVERACQMAQRFVHRLAERETLIRAELGQV